MCARFTVLSDTPIASAMAGCVIPLSRSNTIWTRWRSAGCFLPRSARFNHRSWFFVAFDHLFAPNQMIPTNHILHSMKISRRSSARQP